MLKKSTILFSSYRNIYGLSPPVNPSSTSSCSPKTSDAGKQARRQHKPVRTYATSADKRRKNSHDGSWLPWPEVATNRTPTPYQIFGQRKGTPYSKRRFYELVKLYHPDKHGAGANDGLAYETKLERYRLVVAANDILSDPVKRGAYDAYGAGWNGQPDVRAREDMHGTNSSWGDYSSRGWGQYHGGPSQNATWEDWERWYQRDSGGKQEPTYVSNRAFVAIVIVFAALGGIGNATRANNHGINFVEQKNALHEQVSKDLIRRRKESSTSSDRDERIQAFLKQRDPLGYGLIDPAEEQVRKMLPEPEVCSSEDIKSRSMSVYKSQDDQVR